MLCSITDIQAAIARKSLAEFVREAWHVVEPSTDLVWGRHIDAICSHLEAVTRGEVQNLLINVPPGHMKSLLVCVFWPAWRWLTNPGWRSLFGTYDLGLTTRDSIRCRDLIQSDWYRDTFQPRWLLKSDQNVKTWFENTTGGLRMALAVGGRGTGFRGHTTVFDDPHNVKRDLSDTDLQKAIDWWDLRMSSRFVDMRSKERVGIMQRQHEGDLSGHWLSKADDLVHLCLPTEYDPENPCMTRIGFADWREKAGELLFPELFPASVIEEARRDLQEYGFTGQHNQNPVSREGGIIKKHWFRYWYPQRNPPPPVRETLEDGTVISCHQERLDLSDLEYRFTSSDLGFKDRKENSFVAMGAFGVLGVKRYLLDLVHEHLSFVKTLSSFRALRAAHPGCIAHLIEDKANGPAVMSVLDDEVPELVPIEPKDIGGSKEARCEAMAPTVQRGNLYLPHPTLFDWVNSYVHELCTFPKSKHDDRVDMTSQALNWLRVSGYEARRLECLAMR